MSCLSVTFTAKGSQEGIAIKMGMLEYLKILFVDVLEKNGKKYFEDVTLDKETEGGRFVAERLGRYRDPEEWSQNLGLQGRLIT